MKRILISLFVLAGFLQVYSQKTETRSIGAFDKIDVFGNLIIELVKGEKEKLVIESEDIELDRITTKMDGRTVKVSMAADLYSAGKTVRVKITYQQLYEIYSRGGADVTCDQPLIADRLVFDAASGGNIYVDAEVKSLQAQVGQGSLIRTAGKANSIEVDVSSGGVFSGFELETHDALVKSSTKGKAKINCIKTLTAQASSGGWIGYLGNPPQKTIKTSLGGKVEESQAEE